MEIIKTTQYSERQLYSLMFAAEHSGTHVGYIRGNFSQTLDGFFQEVSSNFRFPYYFGWTWASFDECITDLEWLSFSKILFIIDNSELMFCKEQNPNEYIDLLMKYLSVAVEHWGSQGVLFDCYFNKRR